MSDLMVKCLKCGSRQVFAEGLCSMPIVHDSGNDDAPVPEFEWIEIAGNLTYKCDHCNHVYPKGTVADDFATTDEG